MLGCQDEHKKPRSAVERSSLKNWMIARFDDKTFETESAVLLFGLF